MEQLRAKGLVSEDSEEEKLDKAEEEVAEDAAMQDEPAEGF